MPGNPTTPDEWQPGDDETEADRQIADLLSLRDCLRLDARFSKEGAMEMATRVDGAIKSIREQTMLTSAKARAIYQAALSVERLNAIIDEYAEAGISGTVHDLEHRKMRGDAQNVLRGIAP